MNYNTLSPNAKTIKKVQSFATGQMVTDSEVLNIAVIATGDIHYTQKAVENVVSGIMSKGGVPIVVNIPDFGFLNKVNPYTAKFAREHRKMSMTNGIGIIKTNLVDCVVIVSDCDITTIGLLESCVKCNCPVIVVPMGINKSFCVDVLRSNGKQLARIDDETKLESTALPRGLSPQFGTTTSFFLALEKLGFILPESTILQTNTGSWVNMAYRAGIESIERAENVTTPKKILAVKNKFTDAISECLEMGASINGLVSLLNLVDTKNSHSLFADLSKTKGQVILCRGSACDDGGYVQPVESGKVAFSGKAWVYQTLEDADKAISSGAIDEGVIVLQNCVDTNVSGIIYTIEGMNKAGKIAVATDGVAEPSPVLTITLCKPTSLQNEDFANIQTADVLEIDLAKGRFNTSISAKDMKVRAKRNSNKEAQAYFS
ncbi:MAG: dihydroxy-acid dehydratase [Firmicutes bacterium]|nr:dihydroxy-acid dehydratase [Bacillota bacterium]